MKAVGGDDINVFIFHYFRMLSVLVFMAPSLGLFDLMGHWTAGKLTAAQDSGVGTMGFSLLSPLVYDVKEVNSQVSPVMFKDRWLQTLDYTHYTWLSYQGWGAVLAVLLFPLHLVLVAGIKVTLGRRASLKEAKREAKWLTNFFHLLSNIICPEIPQGWDKVYDSNPSRYEHRQTFVLLKYNSFSGT